MTLIPQWKKWWKRQSVWLIGMIPAITLAREQLPMVKGMIPDTLYGQVMVGLSVASVIAMQIKQASVSGDQQ